MFFKKAICIFSFNILSDFAAVRTILRQKPQTALTVGFVKFIHRALRIKCTQHLTKSPQSQKIPKKSHPLFAPKKINIDSSVAIQNSEKTEFYFHTIAICIQRTNTIFYLQSNLQCYLLCKFSRNFIIRDESNLQI